MDVRKKPILDEIIIMAKQLHAVVKYSPDIRKCVEVAVNQIIGNDKLSRHCVELGITKNDYIDYIMTKL